ncbi:hypothetical protein [Haloarchaeobius litoreus]|jgi:hypothetical protein|uniref:Uncharacterized protein n=1 Tax=Haloarchaeobius litoreus TaxID=755306 RepID=A0ABD6DGZ6_9EURY|nr:hypothetical protein [Haloarchaeobius litoreus]
MNFGGAFDALADDDTWMDAAEVAAGYVGPMALANVAEGATSYDVPNEAYGLLGIYAGEKFDRRMVSVGSGVYTLDALSQRFGLKNTVTNLGGA